MEMMFHVCVPSYTSMCGTVSEFEEWRSNYKEKVPETFCCCGRHGNDVNTYAPSVTSMRATVEEWRSKLKEKCLTLFVVVVVMKTMYYTCAPSFTSMCITVSKLDEWRSSFKENCLRLFVIVYKPVLLWFWCWLLNTSYIQSFVYIALTICELCDPIIMYRLGLFVVVYSKQCCLQTNKYDQSLQVTDIFILTKFHYYMLFRFWVT